jgi:hypothetical protein
MRHGSEAAAQPAAADEEEEQVPELDELELLQAYDWVKAFNKASQFGAALDRRRWKPWQLEQAAATAAASAETAASGKDQAAAAAATATATARVAVSVESSAGGLDSRDLEAWRQGVLGLWNEPYVRVKLELLPLEQQQDPAALNRLSKDLETADLDSDSGPKRPVGRKVVSDSFGEAPSLLLLGRIID